MTEVYYFSGAGHSLAVAEYIARELCCEAYNIEDGVNTYGRCETAVVVFPVYCQNIPRIVKDFLKKLEADYIAFAVTYGGISYGNVLSEAQQLASAIVTSAAIIPMGHTFLDGDFIFDKKPVSLFIERLKKKEAVRIPEKKKNIFADFLPGWRSRVSVKIKVSAECTGCNICGDSCPMNAIKCGATSKDCIRCMKCVTSCPAGALSYEKGFLLNLYLNKKRKKKNIELII